ncbi:MAG: HAD-IA family hydrolase [Acidobacteriota bacterium]
MTLSPTHSRYDLIIFDLDGTLIDSCLDLANSVNHARVRMGMPPLENEIIYSYVGDGASMLIQRSLGSNPEPARVETALGIFLEHYKLHLLDNTVLYPGVRETLAQLGHLTLAVLTNKPINPTRTILEGLAVLDRFASVYGGNSFEQKKPDPVGVYQILDDTGVVKERCLLVGDSRIDIETGRNAGVATCAVTYGLASKTLSDSRPDYIIDNMRQLPAIVLSST